MTDLETFIAFGKMIGLEIIQVTADQFIYIEYSDWKPDALCARKICLTSYGYDDIYFLSKFDLGGNLVEGYVHSHVCNGPDGLRPLINEFKEAVKRYDANKAGLEGSTEPLNLNDVN